LCPGEYYKDESAEAIPQTTKNDPEKATSAIKPEAEESSKGH
jgi:hypothetical protein